MAQHGNTFGKRKRLRFLTADGRMLKVSTKKEFFSNPVDSTVRVGPAVLDGTRPDQLQTKDLHVAYSGNYDPILKHFLDATVEQRLASQGGEIIVARSSRPELQGMVLWRGRYHEVASWLPPLEESVGIEPVRRFDGLRFTDTPDGLLIEPAGPDLYVRPVETVTDIDGVGTLFMYSADQALGKVPTWSGRRIGVGELWKSKSRLSPESPERTVFTTAASSVVATLKPLPGVEAPFTDQLAFIESLSELELAVAS